MRQTGKDGSFHVHFTVPTNKKTGGGVRSLLERKEREESRGGGLSLSKTTGEGVKEMGL